MTLQLASVILQFISSMAIAGGFIFAAIQLKQSRRAQHVSNFMRLVELQMSLRKIRVDHPELATVHKHDVEHLQSEREVQDYFLNLMQLSLFEIAWYAHEQGQLADDYFRSWVKRMYVLSGEESFRKMMANPSMKILHDDFDAYLQGMIRETHALSKT